MMPLRHYFADKSRRVNFNFKERLEVGRHRRIKEWTDVNLSPNLGVKRRETIGKKMRRFLMPILNTLPEGVKALAYKRL